MRVSVFTLGGHELALEVDPGCSLLELKSRIAERIGVQPYRQTLLHRGVVFVPASLECPDEHECAELTLVVAPMRRVLIGSADSTASIWCADSGKCLLSFMGHGGAVYAAAFSSDGASVITGSYQGCTQ